MGINVWVGVRVLVGVRVMVGVRVLVGVRVMVGVRVSVGVRVGVRVFVGVRVLVGVRVTVGVRVSVGVRVTVGVREGVLVFVGVRVIVGLRVLVGLRVFVGVRLTVAVAASVEDDCAIGCGTNAQPIATTAHEIIHQLTTRLIKINLDPILPTPPPGAANSAPGRDCTRLRRIVVERLKKPCFFVIIPPRYPSAPRRGARVVDRGGLENRCGSFGSPRVRIPASPPCRAS